MLLYGPVSDIPHFHCLNSSLSISRAIVITRTAILLPLSLLILCLGFCQWWWPHPLTKTCHADVFTYHWILMELFMVSGTIFTYYSNSTDLGLMTAGSILFISVAYSGQSTFHLLTCVERYLAVVHPVTYRGLNKSCGVKIRNISIACAWLLSFAWMGITSVSYPKIPTVPLLCVLVFSLVVISFCSVSVLRVLIRPQPGRGERDKWRSNQSKERAFLTVSAVMWALWFWFTGILILSTVDVAQFVNLKVSCIVRALLPAFNLPSSLVLPLLYLHRARPPPCCCK